MYVGEQNCSRVPTPFGRIHTIVFVYPHHDLEIGVLQITFCGRGYWRQSFRCHKSLGCIYFLAQECVAHRREVFIFHNSESVAFDFECNCPICLVKNTLFHKIEWQNHPLCHFAKQTLSPSLKLWMSCHNQWTLLQTACYGNNDRPYSSIRILKIHGYESGYTAITWSLKNTRRLTQDCKMTKYQLCL